MAPFYGRLTGDPHCKTVARVGHESVESRLETWEGCVHTILRRDDTFEVYTGLKYSPDNLVYRGTIDA